MAAASAYADTDDYGRGAYQKPALAFATLERQIGRARALSFISAWAAHAAFAHPSADDFFAMLAGYVDGPTALGFRRSLGTTEPFDVSIRSAQCREAHAARGVFGVGEARHTIDAAKAPHQGAWACDVTIVASAAVWTPVAVEFRFADGTAFRETWTPPAANDVPTWHRFSFRRSVPLREVVIDPDQLLSLQTNLLATQLRVAPDMAASARAGARTAHWTQTLMQVVGL